MLPWTLLIAALPAVHAAEPDLSDAAVRAEVGLDLRTVAAWTDTPIAIDGVVDEAAWALATPVPDLLRFEPVDGGTPPGTTDIRVLHDDQYLYVGVRIRDAGYPIRAHVSPRENINEDDQIGVYIDTFADARTGYIFYLNPLGIQQDVRFNGGSWSMSWNTLFLSEGQLTPQGDGFDLEIAFPFRSLSYPSGEDGRDWTISFTRKIPSEGAKYAWPARQRGHPRLMSQNAPLALTPPAHNRRIDIIPALTVVQVGGRDTVDDPLDYNGFAPLLDAVRPSLENARLGLSPDTYVDLSLNPDFSQIEVDATPIDLNQRFAFAFEERRPFFLDGADLLEDRSDTLYSRSIVEPVYGAKLGSREGKIAIGLLHALDASPTASVNQRGAPGFDADEIAGRQAITSLLRLRLDAFRGGYMGFTVADKRVVGTQAVHDAIGVDFEVPLGERWTVAANTHRSTTGDGDRELIGEKNGVALARASGEGTGLELWVDDRTPDYRSETGFITQSGTRQAGVFLDYTFPFQGAVDTWAPWVMVDRFTTRLPSGEPDDDRRSTLELGQTLVFGGVHELGTAGGLQNLEFGGAQVPGYFVEGWYGANFGSALDVGPSVSFQRTLDYDSLEPADVVSVELYAVMRPFVPLRLETELEHEVLTPQGAEPQTADALRELVYLQFDEVHGVRVLTELTTGSALSDRLISSVLFTRLVHPGTALYVGYAETTSLEGGVGALERSVFAKATVLWRP